MRSPGAFVGSLLGLAALPLLSEGILHWNNGSDLHLAVSSFYYQAIVSFLLLCPALLLPRQLARVWTGLIAPVLGLATVITIFHNLAQGVRWNLTAHTATRQSNPQESWEYLRTFASLPLLIAVLALGTAFVILALINLRAQRPGPRFALLLLAGGFSAAALGLHNVVRYKGWSVRDVPVASGDAIPIIGIGITMFHPVTLLAATEFNYQSSHDYYHALFKDQARHTAALAGATVIPGAKPPRLLVVVVGESATRRHLSLYGYARPTTPRLDAIRDQLLVFPDVISTSVGTLESIRNMMTTENSRIPIFHAFSGAGYTTHWISAQSNQGFDDLELGGLVANCDETLFLGNAYDERLLAFFEKAADRPGRQMIFLNLMGSHIRYRDRYPDSETVFRGDSEPSQITAEYDNTIRYTDKVLAALIASLRQRREPACLLYLSDHGEDIYDSDPHHLLFRSESLATDPMYEIPYLLWLSPEYIFGNPEFFRNGLAAALDRPYQTRALLHPLLSLARMTHPVYNPARDPFSPGYVPQVRRIGSAGRVYARTPPTETAATLSTPDASSR